MTLCTAPPPPSPPATTSDHYNNRVQKFDSGGNFITKWSINDPLGIAVDDSGHVYVVAGHIYQYDSGGHLIAEWGSYGAGDGQFNSAFGIAIDRSGAIYVADSNNRRIQMFDRLGNLIAKWGSYGTGNGQFKNPYGVAVDGSGNIYVADTNNHRIQQFGFSATAGVTGLEAGHAYDIYVTAQDIQGNLQASPARVRVTTDQAVAFVTGYPRTDNVKNTSLDLVLQTDRAATAYYGVYDAGAAAPSSADLKIGGTPLTVTEACYATWGKPDGTSGTGQGEFSVPISAAVDSSGNVYIAEVRNNRVQKLDSEGNFLAQLGKADCTADSGDGEFSFPFSVTVDENDRVYVTDVGNNRVQQFDSSGNFLGWLGKDNDGGAGWHGPGSGKTGVSGSGDGEFNQPLGVTVDRDGNIYVTEMGNYRVQKFDAGGNFVTKWGSHDTGEHGDGQFKELTGIAVDESGGVYISDAVDHRVQKFDSSGNFLLKWGRLDCTSGPADGEFNQPSGIAIGSDGSVYVVDSNHDRVQKFDSEGNFISKWGDDRLNYPQGIALGNNGAIYGAPRRHDGRADLRYLFGR